MYLHSWRSSMNWLITYTSKSIGIRFGKIRSHSRFVKLWLYILVFSISFMRYLIEEDTRKNKKTILTPLHHWERSHKKTIKCYCKIFPINRRWSCAKITSKIAHDFVFNKRRCMFDNNNFITKIQIYQNFYFLFNIKI